MVELNLADLFEAVADEVPGREALVLGERGQAHRRLRFEELEARANRLAHVLHERGVGVGDHVGLHLFNGLEHIEAMLGLYKLRAVPVNVNYRYTPDELRYLFLDADLVAVITEPELAAVAQTVRPGVPSLATLLVRGHEYEAELAAASPARVDVGPRSADDLYLLYTGGTTGMPKGVMWRHEDIYFASLGGRGVPSQGIEPLRRPEQVRDRARADQPIRRRLPLCPLMHGGAMWIALQSLLSGGTLVLATDRHFDAADALSLLATERIELTMVIGDATARPLADELQRHPDAHDLSALQVIASGGAIMSPAVKHQLQQLLPHTKVVDTFGASETGGQGRLSRRSSSASHAGAPRLISDADTAVFDDDLVPLEPGSAKVGRLGRTGHIPLGYYKDPDKTAATFPVIDGVRWAVPGDLALVEDDGAIVLLGRGAATINTGGEKVFPEEVEGVVKSHPRVFDALVVGVPDERFGETVVAVVALRGGPDPGADDGADDDDLAAHARAQLSGYKVPRSWVRVGECRRTPTGKPDYAWARVTACTALGIESPAGP